MYIFTSYLRWTLYRGMLQGIQKKQTNSLRKFVDDDNTEIKEIQVQLAF